MYGNDRFDRTSRGGFNKDGFVAPVQVGDEIEVRIEALGEKGDGIARRKGFVIFVPEVAKDDMVKIKITKVLKKVAFAEVVEKLDSITEEPQKGRRPAAVAPVEEDILPEIPEEDFENASEDFGEDDSEEDDLEKKPKEADSLEQLEEDNSEEIPEEEKKEE